MAYADKDRLGLAGIANLAAQTSPSIFIRSSCSSPCILTRPRSGRERTPFRVRAAKWSTLWKPSGAQAARPSANCACRYLPDPSSPASTSKGGRLNLDRVRS